jgi:UDPglucose 6-dehydrogenase
MRILKSVEAVNDDQKKVLFNKLSDYYKGDLTGKRVALWGLSFKPETDDMREAPALVLIDELLCAGCVVTAYDPVAMEESKRRIGDKISYANDLYESIENADALLIVTEWKEFRLPAWVGIKAKMHVPLIIDGRNIYDATEMKEAGFIYKCIGK